MKKIFLLIILTYNTFIVFSQDNLFFGYTNKYIEMEEWDKTIYNKEDVNKFYFMKDIKNSEKLEIKEYGDVFNYRKFGLWTGFNEQNEIVCHRFYNIGYLEYDIVYYKNKLYALVNYDYNRVIFDEWREEKDIGDMEINYRVNDIIFYAEDGQIKSQYYYDGSEYIEKKYNVNKVLLQNTNNKLLIIPNKNSLDLKMDSIVAKECYINPNE
ncbi:MAG: hypothetical protein GX259_07910, partial [Bacteroidales bacterium]|nr:hypothetical protein [Bacteroidales bacterium]